MNRTSMTFRTTIMVTSIGGLLTRHMDNDSRDFFRCTEALGMESQRGTRGRAYIINFNPDTHALDLPANLIYLKRNIMMGAGIANSSLIVTTGKIEGLIAHGLTQAAQYDPLDFPPDGHFRWQTSAPPMDNVQGYLVHGNITLHIPTKDSGEKTKDIHAVKTMNKFVVHYLTASGRVFRMDLPFETVILDRLPEAVLVAENVNCLVTIHSKNRAKLITGTNEGLHVDGNLIESTRGQKITQIAVDSEAPLLFFVGGKKLYCIPMTYGGELSHEIVSLDTAIQDNEQVLSGPNTRIGDKGVLVTSWENSSEEGRLNLLHRVVPTPPPHSLPPPPIC